MFSEAEQRRLAEIEALLRADDPAFVHQFDAHRNVSRRRILTALWFVLALPIAAIALLAGSFGVAILALCGMVAAAGFWLYRLR